MSRVVVLGSINMDVSIESARMPHEGETINGKNLLISPGGKGANQAVAAARAGAQTYMVAAVGADEFGVTLQNVLLDAGVHTQAVEKTAGSSGVAVVLRSGGNNRIIIEHGANYELDEARALAALKELLGEGGVFLVQFECPDTLVDAAIQQAHAQGATVIVNPSPARAIHREVLSCIDVLCLNETECEQLFGLLPTIDDNGTCPPSAALQEKCFELAHASTDDADHELAYAGDADHERVVTPCLVVTLGAQGSLIVTKDGCWHQVSFSVDTLDTTAAGDTFVGYVAACLAQNMAFPEACKLASQAAALACTKVGAQVSIPTKADVVAYFERNDS